MLLSRRIALAALASSALPLRAARADYPERPIQWIVAYAAGGGSDTVARILAEHIAPALAQSIVVENKPGGGATIGARAAASAEPDGYTVFSADNGVLIYNTALYKKLSYDPAKDFRPVGLMVRFPLLLVVGADSESQDIAGLVARAKASPGAIDYASPGIGSPHHLAMERMMREAGLEFTHVPYKGAAPALVDLTGGHIEFMIVDYPSGAGQLKAGKIRPLAVCSAARLPSLPDVPTVAEALGLNGFEAYAWQGLVVPAGTPDAIVDRWSTLLAAALADPAVDKRLREIGLEPLQGGPKEMQALMDADRAVWLPLISSLNITLD
ncbi:MAG: tripartite tricarboxylate transporter substrate binding protein [Geminicoccaceae bacterium]